MEDLLLIGGSNVDYIGRSDTKLIKKVSNIGTITISFGGVIRNTTENLLRIGNKCNLLTAIGDDLYGNKLKEYMISLGVNLICPKTKYPSATYLAINDESNDMALGICDNRIMDDLNSKFIDQNKELILKHKYIIIDSNLSSEVIDYLFDNFKDQKFICEGISPSKVIKYRKHLNEIFLLKCNIHEAQALINIELVERDLVGALLVKGIKNVVVSNRSDDIYYGSNNRDIGMVHVDEIKEFKNTTGCGDALFSGVIDYFIQGHNLKESVAFGNKLAAITLNTYQATNEEISSLYYEHK